MKALEYLLNLKTNKASFSAANGDVKTLKENILGIGKALDTSEKSLASFAKSQKWVNISTAAKNITGAISEIGGNIKAVVQGSFSLVNDFASAGDSLAKTSRLIGLSVENYQAFRFAAERSGMGVEELDGALKKFNITLGKAKSGDKNSLKIFDALLAKDVNSYKTSKEILVSIADSYTKLSESQKAFVSQSVFGKSGLKMSEVFASGGEGVEKLIAEYQSLGGGISDKDAKNAEEYEDAMSNMLVSLYTSKAMIVGELVPAMTGLFKGVTKFFKEHKKEINEVAVNVGQKFAKAISDIVPKLPAIFDVLTSIAGVVASVVDFIGPVKSLLAVGILGSLGSIIVAVSSLVALIGGPAVAAIAAAVVGLTAWISVIADIYKNFDMLKSFLTDDFFGPMSDCLENSIAGGIVRGVRKAIKSIPVIGDLIFSDVDFNDVDSELSAKDISSGMGDVVGGTTKTTTNRFSVDFKNMPKGVQVTAPTSGDFDYSYGYVLGGF